MQNSLRIIQDQANRLIEQLDESDLAREELEATIERLTGAHIISYFICYIEYIIDYKL